MLGVVKDDRIRDENCGSFVADPQVKRQVRGP